MIFMKADNVEVRILEGSDQEVAAFTECVNRGLTTEHLFTGSFPMRAIDVKERWKEERDDGDVLFGIWINEAPAPERFVGVTGLHSHKEIYRSWEFRILIFDPGQVGQGIGKKVCCMVTDYAFTRLNAHRVWLGVSEDNIRAVKCYLDCGYRLEGRLRDELFYGGQYHAVIRMGLIEGESHGGQD